MLETKIKKLLSATSLITIASLFVLSINANANSVEKSPIKFTSKAQKVITVENIQGVIVKKLTPAIKVLPGEIVQYTNTFKNIGTEKADNIGVTNKIPEHTVYISNTASGNDFNITYSVDNGKHWAIPSALKVKGQDGKMYNATATDYTNIRWKYKKNLHPNETKNISYQVRVL